MDVAELRAGHRRRRPGCPTPGQAWFSDLAGGLSQALIRAVAVQEIDKILDFGDPFRRQCFELVDQFADMLRSVAITKFS